MFKIGGKGGVAAQKKGGGPAWHADFKFTSTGAVEDVSDDDDDGVERHLVALEGVVESLQGQRRKMEDACTVVDYLHLTFPDLSSRLEEAMECGRNFSFYGVFDGHAGHRAARILKQQMHSTLFQNPLFAEKKIEEAFRTSFREVDRVILEQGKEQKWKDGACAVTAAVIDDYLYVANAGDSECVLGRRRRKRRHVVHAEKDVYPSEQERDFPDWIEMAPFPTPGHDAIIVSKAHKTSDPEEQKRVIDAGGMITFGRLFGDLAVARAFGDSEYKMPLAAADYISVEPHVRQVPLDEYDEFIIMASDGLWDKINAQEAVDMVSKYLEQKVRSGRPVAHAPPPAGTPLSMDAVQTPYTSVIDLPEENAGEDDDSGEEKAEEAPAAAAPSKLSKLQMMKNMKAVNMEEGVGGGEDEGDVGVPRGKDLLRANKRLVKNKKSKFKNTSKLNQLSLGEIKSKKKHISAQLINEALERGSKDNCTVIVVFFQWEETNS